MSAVTWIESRGVKVVLSGPEKFKLTGLDRLPEDQARAVVDFARANKPRLLAELNECEPVNRQDRASDGLPLPPEDATLELLTVAAMAEEWNIQVDLAPGHGLELRFPPRLRPELRRVFLEGLDRCGEQVEKMLDRRSRGRWAQ